MYRNPKKTKTIENPLVKRIAIFFNFDSSLETAFADIALRIVAPLTLVFWLGVIESKSLSLALIGTVISLITLVVKSFPPSEVVPFFSVRYLSYLSSREGVAEVMLLVSSWLAPEERSVLLFRLFEAESYPLRFRRRRMVFMMPISSSLT